MEITQLDIFRRTPIIGICPLHTLWKDDLRIQRTKITFTYKGHCVRAKNKGIKLISIKKSNRTRIDPANNPHILVSFSL